MKEAIRRIIKAMPALAFMVLAVQSACHAAGTSGGVFLNVGVSAKAEAMGGAYSAIVDDASSVTINPAGMVQVKGQQVSLMHNESLMDIDQEYFAYVTNMGDKAYGLSLTYVDFGSQGQYSAQNQFLGVFVPKGYALSFAYAVQATEVISYGVALKYISQEIAQYDDTTFALDAGLIYRPTQYGFRGAVVLSHLGSGLTLYQNEDPLPLTLKLATAYEWEQYPLIAAMDLYLIRDEDPEYHAGLQYTLSEIVPVRIGYDSGPDLDNGMTYGIGVLQENFSLDYAYVPAGEFDDQQRFSVVFSF